MNLPYYHPDVRNLAWILAAPSLLKFLPEFNQPLTVLDDQFWQQQYQAYLPRLQQLEDNPLILEQFLAEHNNHRLGYYFEYLLLFWLQDNQYHCFELIKHRATLFKGKITIGELDYLVRNKITGEIEHWEVAIKFYLGYPPLTDAYHWLGANDNDSLGRKLHHLATKQFLADQYQDYKINKRCLLVKGRLFYPSTAKNLLARAHSPTVSCLSSDHLQGNWIMYQDFINSPEAAQLQWRHVGKDEWLADQQPFKQLPLANSQHLPPLPTARAELFLGFNAQLEEQARCFVCGVPRTIHLLASTPLSQRNDVP